MANPDLSMVLSLRRVLESASDGEGMARGLIEGLRGTAGIGADAARMLLLGYPISVSLRPFEEVGSPEAAMLASLIVSTPRSSARLVGDSGKTLADTLEKWVKLRENRKLEQKVLRFRSLIISAVLGAVASMIATLGPVVGSLTFESPSGPRAGALIPAAAAMVAVSSMMLGLYMSGRRFPLNVIVSLAVFGVVSALASPLSSLPSLTFWGVK
jgi:hypothetical protein